MAQLSLLFSQKTWFKVKDLDDCWVITILQGVFAICPWLRLPNTETVRKWAGDPDDGIADGGNIKEIMTALRVGWPDIGKHAKPHRGIAWAEFKAILVSGRGMSIALMPGKLSPELRHGVNDVPHQCYISAIGLGEYAFFNPWNDTPARPDIISLAEIRAAVLEYGNGSVYGVSFPTETQMLPTHPAYKSTLDSSIARMINDARTEGYKSGFEQARNAASLIANDAENKILAMTP